MPNSSPSEWFRRSSTSSDDTLAEEKVPLKDDYESRDFKNRTGEFATSFRVVTDNSIRLRTAILQIVSAVCLTVVLMLLFFGQDRTSCIERNSSVYGNIPTRRVVFQEDVRFIETSPFDDGSPWQQLFPSGRGFVRVENPAEHGLEDGWRLEDGAEGYETSMFHQLYCLAHLRSMMTDLMSPEGAAMQQQAKMWVRLISEKRANHCFEYLRQAIMCAGDLTLERATYLDGMRLNGATPWNVTHECRDWKTMYDYADSHSYTTGQEIVL